MKTTIVPVLDESTESSREGEHDSGRDRGCNVSHLLTTLMWNKSAIQISWLSDKKMFKVRFSGKQSNQTTRLNDLLSKEIPLEIARTSSCECGGVLELGDYSVQLKSGEYIFEGDYYCPQCKKKRIAKSAGLKGFITKWVTNLTKIEITPSGVGIEREPAPRDE